MSVLSAAATILRSRGRRRRDASNGTEPAEASWARFLGGYLRPFRARFTLLAVLILGGIGFQLAGPQLIRSFIDTASAHGAQPKLLLFALAALGAAIANELMGAAATFIGQDVGWAATNRIREDLALHLLRLDMSYHNLHTPGEFIERIDGDLTNLSNFFAIVLLKVVGSALLLLGTLALVWLADWRVGLTLTIFVAVAFAVIVKMRSIAVPAGIEEREVSATFLGFLEERLAGVEDIRANGGGAYMMDRFYRAMRSWFSRSVHAWTRRSSIWTVTTLLFATGMSLTLGLSAYLYVVAHAISLGTVYLFFQYTVLLEAPIEQITQQMQEYQKALSSVIRVRRLFALHAAITDAPSASASLPEPAAQPPQLDGRSEGTSPLPVRFDHVTFAYRDGEEPVLRDVDFTLPAGQVMGLLGRTGSGKTTISRLLSRLYDTTQGAVLLDGVDVRDLPLAELRRRVGVVTQDVQLFQATVRENLTFFDPRVSDRRILDVIEEMDLRSWLARLPDGLDTHLEAGGGGLSAGEAQLLAFIRVFLRNPGLVILDEPSSRLDLATERLIEHGVRALLRGRTAIIIAHRLATVRRADRILTLGDGRILEYGPRVELERARDSQYARLLRLGLEEALA